ncbi:MAG: Hpt domain-containing protein [Cyanobacteria bacterium P01_D01_bin.1]
MLPEQQQRIMGYFIEEAKDHLNTIEQGLLNLQATIQDAEKANEIFRAAHSVKGGAAMLGLESIQKTAHRMEDYFKVLKESPIKVDRALETMFLRVSDGLKDLIEQLEGPFGLTPEKAKEIMAGVEPVFLQLEAHLKSLVENDLSSTDINSTGTTYSKNADAIQVVFRQDVAALLRQMLAVFKQPDTPESRKDLQTVCVKLTELGEGFGLFDWCDLTETARIAAANSDREYRTLAPILIREIKNAQDLVLAGRTSEVAVSDAMQLLLPEDILAAEPLADITEYVANEFAQSHLDQQYTADDLKSVEDSSTSEPLALEVATEMQQDEAFELNSELFSELSTEQLSVDDLFEEENSSTATDLNDVHMKDLEESFETDDLDDFDTLFSVNSDESFDSESLDD